MKTARPVKRAARATSPDKATAEVVAEHQTLPSGSPAKPPAAAPAFDTKREAALLKIEDDYYQILAGGTRMFQLLAMVDLGLPHLLLHRGAMTEEEIIAELHLHHTRGHKWVLLLESVGLLLAQKDGIGVTRFAMPEAVRAIVDPDAPNHFFYRDFLRYWRVAASKDTVALLRGAKVADPVRYPPVLWEDVVLLHDWMRDGALATLASIQRRFDFSKYQRILDVAGGDATKATTLVKQQPGLHVTVFNLPAAAALCRKNIAAQGLTERVRVVEGDFRIDTFPTDFQLVMFSRVMADWSPAVCKMLMQKARAALKPGGHLLIAEPMRDDNPDLSIAWEHSYLPYDDFGAYVYKLRDTYAALMAETGFRLLTEYGRQDTIHSILIAEAV